MSNPYPPQALKSHISSDIFLYVPSSPDSTPHPAARTPPWIIFFVTGNPGLIAYYHAFLSILSTTTPTSECVIAGFSLGGFEIDHHHVGDKQHPTKYPGQRPRDVAICGRRSRLRKDLGTGRAD